MAQWRIMKLKASTSWSWKLSWMMWKNIKTGDKLENNHETNWRKKNMETHIICSSKEKWHLLSDFFTQKMMFTCFWDRRVPFTTKKLADFMDSDSKVRSPHPSFDALHANHGHPQQPRCNWKVHCTVPFTLHKTNTAPENGVPQKDSSVPRINFHVLG